MVKNWFKLYQTSAREDVTYVTYPLIAEDIAQLQRENDPMILTYITHHVINYLYSQMQLFGGVGVVMDGAVGRMLDCSTVASVANVAPEADVPSVPTVPETVDPVKASVEPVPRDTPIVVTSLAAEKLDCVEVSAVADVVVSVGEVMFGAIIESGQTWSERIYDAHTYMQASKEVTLSLA